MLQRAAEGGRRQLTGGPQAAATRGGVRGARGLEWAARPAVGPDGKGRKKKGERKGVGPAGLGFGPGQAVLFVFFFLLKSNQGSNSNRIYSKTWRSLTGLV